jgi:hypothetical protein
MRRLSQHYSGLTLPEAPVFGLGTGAAEVYLSEPGIDPIPPVSEACSQPARNMGARHVD